MEVNSVNSSYSNTSSTTRQTSSLLDKDAFLRLLVEQLKNQDPMNPQDSSEFLAQMAQFTIVEQLANLNDEISELKQSHETMEAAGLIGKQVSVTTEDGSVSGTVEKVTIDGDEIKVFVNGNSYYLEDVTEISNEE